MMTEKQLIDLINALQKSNFSVWEIILISILVIILTIVLTYITSNYTQKAKNDADNLNYENIKSQLESNTKIIKEVERKITSELWISQQIWQKKYEMYDSIYTQLLSIHKWADNQSFIVDLHMRPEYLKNSHHPYMTESQEKEFFSELEAAYAAIKDTLDQEAVKAKTTELQIKLSEAMTSLAEIMITKSIILNPAVTETLKKLITDIGKDPRPLNYEEPDDYEFRITSAIENAINAVKRLALSELKIAQ